MSPENLDGDIVAALIDGNESTLKTYPRQGDEITLTPIETKHHLPRTFHSSHITIQGVLIEIVRRNARRKKSREPAKLHGTGVAPRSRLHYSPGSPVRSYFQRGASN